MDIKTLAIINEFKNILEESTGPVTFVPWGQDHYDDFSYVIYHPKLGTFSYSFSTLEQLQYLQRFNELDYPTNIVVNNFGFGGRIFLNYYGTGTELEDGVAEFNNLYAYANTLTEEESVKAAYLVAIRKWCLNDAIEAAINNDKISVYLHQSPYTRVLMEILSEVRVGLIPILNLEPMVQQRLAKAKHFVNFHKHTIVDNIPQ